MGTLRPGHWAWAAAAVKAEQRRRHAVRAAAGRAAITVSGIPISEVSGRIPDQFRAELDRRARLFALARTGNRLARRVLLDVYACRYYSTPDEIRAVNGGALCS